MINFSTLGEPFLFCLELFAFTTRYHKLKLIVLTIKCIKHLLNQDNDAIERLLSIRNLKNILYQFTKGFRILKI
ncbi:MAG: hypothetical protein CM15mP111_4660 [Hyphomicrobiales bacterium]|nr:MAG: hypothetical protein CM15mP111_4660 [Hyphomicrobiales bacterium]